MVNDKTKKAKELKENTKNASSGVIGNTPKGTRLSKRITIGIISAGVMVIMIIFYCLLAYTPHYDDSAPAVNQKDQLEKNITDSNKNTVSADETGLANSVQRMPDSVPGAFGQKSINTTQAKDQNNNAESQEIPINSEDEKELKAAMQSGLSLNSSGTGYDNNSSQSQSEPSSMNSGSRGGDSDSANPLNLMKNQYADQNMQDQKSSFMEKASQYQEDYIKHAPESPLFKYELKAGSIIPAILETGINSDLPGQIIARVREKVYDTRSGNYLLIPQGSTLMGVYDSQVAYGQSRVLIAWSRIIFPNGESLDLEGMPGADLAGMAGLHDLVDNHYMKIFGSALLMSVFSAGVQLSQPNTSNNNNNAAPTTQQILAASLGQQLGTTAMQMTQKNLNIQPTIEIRPGDEFNVLVTKDVPFKHPYALR